MLHRPSFTLPTRETADVRASEFTRSYELPWSNDVDSNAPAVHSSEEVHDCLRREYRRLAEPHTRIFATLRWGGSLFLLPVYWRRSAAGFRHLLANQGRPMDHGPSRRTPHGFILVYKVRRTVDLNIFAIPDTFRGCPCAMGMGRAGHPGVTGNRRDCRDLCLFSFGIYRGGSLHTAGDARAFV